MIIQNGHKISGVYIGDTPLKKIFYGDDIIFPEIEGRYPNDEFHYQTTPSSAGLNNDLVQIPDNPIISHTYDGNEWVVKYTFPVTELPDYFCTNHVSANVENPFLKEIIYLPKTIEKIGSKSFYNCISLVGLNLNLPRLTTIDGDCFVALNKCKSITFRAPKLREINGYFLTGSEIEKISLDFPRLTSIESGFLLENDKLTSVKLNVPNVQSIGDNFLNGNKKLTELKLTTQKLLSIGNGFCYGCDVLTDIYFDAPLLTNIGGTFCAIDKNNEIRDEQVLNVTLNFNSINSIYDNKMFENHPLSKSLSRIYVPSGKLVWFNVHVPDLSGVFYILHN